MNVVYVIDKTWKLIDEIRLREICLPSRTTIEDLMDYRYVGSCLMTRNGNQHI